MKNASTSISLRDPMAVLNALAGHLREHDLEVAVEAGRAEAKLPYGRAVLTVSGPTIAVDASARNQAELESVTGFLAAHMLEFAHPESPTIAWSGFEQRELFADFREMHVVSVTDLTPTMRRVRLAGEDLQRFASQADLHVRLFFGSQGLVPEWPTRGPDGLSLEPTDPARKALVRKYTIRHIDAAAGWVDIDFVLHADPGPGGDWAKQVREGDLLGMAGPGGRTARAADWMLLAGDETALPAIARILEALPITTQGVALIESDAEAGAIELAHPSGVSVQWLAKGTDLATAVLGVEIPYDKSRFCWAGAEFSAIQRIRGHWRSCGLSKDEQLAVAYWRKGQAGS